MPYDFTTDIKNFTRLDSVPSTIVTWALDQAKTVYVGDPTDYDDTISAVDNRLLSILASAFVVMWNNGIELPSLFKLDEFSIQQGDNKEHPELKFFEMFLKFLRDYQLRGFTLQYVDNGELIALSTYDATLYEIARPLPEGVDQ